MSPFGRLCEQCGSFIEENGAAGGCSCTRPPTVAHRVRRKIYDDPRWRKRTRPRVIARDGGVCVRCGAAGVFVDHVIGLAALLAQGRDPFSPDECQLLCARCSGEKDGGRRWRDDEPEAAARAPAQAHAPRLV